MGTGVSFTGVKAAGAWS